jgi:hypothetical protein
MPSATREWYLGPDELALLAPVLADHVPSGDYDCPAVSWDCAKECERLRREAAEAVDADPDDGVALDAVARWDHIGLIALARLLQDPVRREHGRRHERAKIDVVVPEGVLAPRRGNGATSSIRFDPFRAVPVIDAEGRRMGYHQISFIFRVSRPEFDAAVQRVITDADGRQLDKAAVLRYRAKWDQHPEAKTLEEAFLADDLDPMAFAAEADAIFGS